MKDQLFQVSEILEPDWAAARNYGPGRWYRVVCMQTEIEGEGADLNEVVRWLGLFASGAIRFPASPRFEGRSRFSHVPYKILMEATASADSSSHSRPDGLGNVTLGRASLKVVRPARRD